jgi:hypothetical protein
MTQKTIFTILFLSIFLFSFASAYDSGWTQFTTSSGCCIDGCGSVCGEEQESCIASNYGLSFLHQTKDCTGSGWRFLVQKSNETPSEYVIKTYNGAGAEKTHFESLSSGNYYLHIKGDYDPAVVDASIYAGIGDYPSSNWDSIVGGKLVSDQGGHEQNCVITTPFNLASGTPNVWIKGISTGLTSNAIRSYRLTSCIEDGLRDCNGGTILTGNCNLVGGPVVELISPENTTYNTNLITVDASADQDIDFWNYTLNGTSEGNFNPGSTILNLSEGCYDLTAFGTNINGTGSDSAHFCINLSGNNTNTVPKITIISPENKTYTTNWILINVTSNQVISTWEMSLDGGSFSGLTNPETQWFEEGCWVMNVSGTNINGTGYDSVSFCVDLNSDPEEPKRCSKNSCNRDKDDSSELRPELEDFFKYGDRENLVLGVETTKKKGVNLQPVIIGLLLLGIVITLILLVLLYYNKSQ